ncbi:GNAT family N-acetyltransferase [Azomonas macrocytogenes]|uniref:RimJ/RimL family protein N-acetyltransferase n=1 Tax=Azomonas macrocytogenes TaxID=69962 RepID=A0A839T8M3_AZOMA|nr:GNAT family protein [Azomonas macrocytogenes]MBB3104806.1 RimJ/RimL family protein N-acetyltransferase [Azomonas macrocytogenes]
MFRPAPIILQRGALRLQPLVEADIPCLVDLAQRNHESLVYMNGPLRPDWYRRGLNEQAAGQSLIFSIRLADRIVGTTRFSDFQAYLPAAELGWSWLESEQHGSGLNTTIKYLMLCHAFGNWKLVRVQLKTAASNLRAQKAIEKLGASPEGRLRNHRRLGGGRLDDTLLYSITDHDWPAVRQGLEARFT